MYQNEQPFLSFLLHASEEVWFMRWSVTGLGAMRGQVQADAKDSDQQGVSNTNTRRSQNYVSNRPGLHIISL